MDTDQLQPSTDSLFDVYDGIAVRPHSTMAEDDHYDPLSYLDDLPFDLQQQHQQQPETAITHEAEEDEEDEYIDVSLPWTKEGAHGLGALEKGHASDPGDKISDNHEQLTPSLDSGSSNNNEPATAFNRPPTALKLESSHHHRSHQFTFEQGDSQWAVNLNVLLVSTNGTLEKFHLNKWKECFQLVRQPFFNLNIGSRLHAYLSLS